VQALACLVTRASRLPFSNAPRRLYVGGAMILLQGGHAPHIAPRRLYVGGAMILLQTGHAPHIVPADFMSVERWFSFRLRTRDTDNVREGVDRRRKNSWQEARDFNHRSTDIKSAGARMDHKPGSGAKSSLHRRKVGGGNLVAE